MSEAFEVEWSTRARRDVYALSERVAGVIAEFVYGPLAQNPHRVGKSMLDPFIGYHSARRGDYRVVYRIDEDERVITIQRVGHRSKVYRP